MSRYTGPRLRVMRALGINLPGLSRKTIDRRPYPPGQHGQARKKLSEFGIRKIEKQKLRMNYGLTERQLRRLMLEAKASKQNTTDKIVELVERRLDNVVYRAGFAPTIVAARQLVNHGHMRVGGRKVDIPSFRVSVGDLIRVRDKSRDLPIVRAAIELGPPFDATWLDVDTKQRKVAVTGLPDGAPFPLDVQLVVEYYAKSL